MEINTTTKKNVDITLTKEEVGYLFLALDDKWKIARKDVNCKDSIEYLKLADSMNQIQRMIEVKK